MTKGPLAGYMIACPSCGFTELHMHEKVRFTFRHEAGPIEEEPRSVLIGMEKPPKCLYCTRTIYVQVDPSTGKAMLSATHGAM
jgi:hypothetical protein